MNVPGRTCVKMQHRIGQDFGEGTFVKEKNWKFKDAIVSEKSTWKTHQN